MQLKEWIKTNGHTQKWVAKETGLSQVRLHYLITSKAKPNLSEVCKFYDLTHGIVTYWDWAEQHNVKRNAK